MKNKFYFPLLLFILLLATFSGRKYIFSDYTAPPRIQLKSVPFFGYDYSWLENTNLGVTNVGFPSIPGHLQTSSTPMMVYYWKLFLLGSYHLFGEAFDRVLFLFFISLPFWGVYFLSLHLQEKKLKDFSLSSFVAGLIYMTSSWSITIFNPFLYAFIFAFGIFPVLIFLYYKTKEAFIKRKNRLIYLLSGALLLALVEQVFFHLLIIFGLFIGLTVLFEFLYFEKRKILSAASAGLLLLILSLLLNIHVFLSSYLFPTAAYSSEVAYFSFPAVNFNGLNSSLSNVVRQIDHYYWFGDFKHHEALPFTWWHYSYFLFSSLSIFIFRKKKRVLFFVLPLFLGIFLAKGLNPPLRSISEFIYLKFPFMQGFRDPKKFSLLIILSYSFLIGLFFEYLYGKISKKITFLIPLFLLFVWLYFLNPFFFAGDFGLTLNNNLNPPPAYEELKKEIKQDHQDFRVLTLGLPETLRDYSWYEFELDYPGTESLYLFDKPTAKPREVHLTPSSRFSGFVEAESERFKEALFYSSLLNKINVKYLIFDDQLRVSPKSKEKFVGAKEFEEKKLSGFSLFENKNNDNMPFSLADKVLFIVGNYQSLESIYYLEPSALKLPVLWLGDGKNRSQELEDIPGVVIFKGTDITDLLASQLLAENQLDATQSVERNYGTADYWYSYEPYVYRFIQSAGVTFLSGKSIAAEAAVSLSVPFEVKKEANHQIFIRPLLREAGGVIEVLLDGEFVSQVDANLPGGTFLKWLDLGQKKLKEGRHQLELKNLENNWVILDGIIVAPYEKIEEEKKKMGAFLNEREVIFIDDPGLDRKKVASLIKYEPLAGEIFSYRKVSPSEYEVLVDYEKPAFLTFKHSYDRYWNLDDQPHFFVDYYANGYFIKSGEFAGTLRHEPNKIYRAILFTSEGLFVFVLLLQAFLLIKSLKTSIT